MKTLFKALGYMILGGLIMLFGLAFVLEESGKSGELSGKTFRCGKIVYQLMVVEVMPYPAIKIEVTE